MTTRDPLFACPSFLRNHVHFPKMVSAEAKHTLFGYSIIAIAALLFTLLFSSPQVFAATAQNQGPKKQLFL